MVSQLLPLKCGLRVGADRNLSIDCWERTKQHRSPVNRTGLLHIPSQKGTIQSQKQAKTEEATDSRVSHITGYLPVQLDIPDLGKSSPTLGGGKQRTWLDNRFLASLSVLTVSRIPGSYKILNRVQVCLKQLYG